MPLRPAYGSRPIRGLTSPCILCRKWVATHMRVINSHNYDPHMGRDPFAGRYCANDMPQMQRVAFEDSISIYIPANGSRCICGVVNHNLQTLGFHTEPGLAWVWHGQNYRRTPTIKIDDTPRNGRHHSVGFY